MNGAARREAVAPSKVSRLNDRPIFIQFTEFGDIAWAIGTFTCKVIDFIIACTIKKDAKSNLNR